MSLNVLGRLLVVALLVVLVFPWFAYLFPHLPSYASGLELHYRAFTLWEWGPEPYSLIPGTLASLPLLLLLLVGGAMGSAVLAAGLGVVVEGAAKRVTQCLRRHAAPQGIEFPDPASATVRQEP